jgi:hypothetical protein
VGGDALWPQRLGDGDAALLRTWCVPAHAGHTFARINTRFIGVDPKHGRDGAPQWSPLVLHDATLLT